MIYPKLYSIYLRGTICRRGYVGKERIREVRVQGSWDSRAHNPALTPLTGSPP